MKVIVFENTFSFHSNFRGIPKQYKRVLFYPAFLWQREKLRLSQAMIGPERQPFGQLRGGVKNKVTQQPFSLKNTPNTFQVDIISKNIAVVVSSESGKEKSNLAGGFISQRGKFYYLNNKHCENMKIVWHFGTYMIIKE